MIEVDGLTAGYRHGRPVLSDVSFQAGRGEVVGLLGANGAGKTTLLRVLAGLLHPAAGRVRVAGFDVTSQRLAAQRSLAYLPEEAALDGEFRVEEYLHSRAALRGLSSERGAARTAEVLAQVGLADSQRRLIAQLSKGYRQRLGLADALLAAPSVLLLDEPTDGLDPRQRTETLQLIAALSAQHTVLLSTHILPEAESICQRVLILEAGRVSGFGPPSALAAAQVTAPAIVVRCRGDRAALLAALKAVPGVADIVVASEPAADTPSLESAQAKAGSDAPWSLTVRLAAEHVPQTADRLARAVLEVGELCALTPQHTKLETLFRHLSRPVA